MRYRFGCVTLKKKLRFHGPASYSHTLYITLTQILQRSCKWQVVHSIQMIKAEMAARMSEKADRRRLPDDAGMRDCMISISLYTTHIKGFHVTRKHLGS